MANRLALAIPTYGRSEAVAENLAHFAEEARRLNVSLYYSDDTHDDSVETVVRQYAQTFSNIRYQRNDPPLGHDKNVIRSLTWPDEDYIWVMGDVWRPKQRELENILGFLNDQDMIFLNRKSKDGPDLPDVTDDAAHNFIREKLWNQTLTGATIYHRRVRNWVLETAPDIKRNFPQLSIILGFSSCQPVSLGWRSDAILDSANKTESYWHSKALDVFIDDWAHVVTAYPDIIHKDDVHTVLKSHSEKTNVFNVDFLMSLRKNRHLNWSSLNRTYFWDTMHLSRAKIISVLILPPIIARAILKLKWWHKITILRRNR